MDCKDTYFLSVRGSGQTTSSPETHGVYNGLATEASYRARKLTTDFTEIDYPAPSVRKILDSYPPAYALGVGGGLAQILKIGMPQYLAGELQGETALISKMGAIAKNCRAAGKTPAIVIAGYSQGALAIRNVLYTLSVNNSTNILPLIQGVALIGDPGRMPDSALKNYGNASKRASWGLCHSLDLLPGNDSCRPGQVPREMVEIPSGLRPVTVENCASGDIVCDNTALARGGSFANSAYRGYVTHTDCVAYCFSTSNTIGADFAKRIVGRKPAAPTIPVGPAPVPLRSEGPAGQAIYFRMQGCPDAGPNLHQGLYKADLETLAGKVIDTADGIGVFPDTLADGSPPFLSTRGRQLPGHTDFSETPKGQYNVRVSCTADDGQVIKTYQPFRYTVSKGSQRVGFSPTVAARGATVTFTSIDPCPAPVGYRGRYAATSLAPIGQNADTREFITVLPPVRANDGGQWSQTFVIPPGTAPGDYGVGADCGDLDYGYSGTLSVR